LANAQMEILELLELAPAALVPTVLEALSLRTHKTHPIRNSCRNDIRIISTNKNSS
jgi:hypothetical protein